MDDQHADRSRYLNTLEKTDENVTSGDENVQLGGDDWLQNIRDQYGVWTSDLNTMSTHPGHTVHIICTFSSLDSRVRVGLQNATRNAALPKLPVYIQGVNYFCPGCVSVLHTGVDEIIRMCVPNLKLCWGGGGGVVFTS